MFSKFFHGQSSEGQQEGHHTETLLRWGKRAAGGAAVLVVLAQIVAVSYHQGTRVHETGLIVAGYDEVQTSRAALDVLRADSQAQIDLLSARTALLQARLERLDALGSRLVAAAGLSEEASEFDFSTVPGLGGRDSDVPLESTAGDALAITLASMRGQLEDREMQLHILEGVMRDRNIAIEARPNQIPVRSGWISSGYGWRKDPFHGRRAFHKGVDIAARFKSSVQAAAAGMVTFAGYKTGYGNIVEVNHGAGYRSRYAHAHTILVKVGEIVARGQELALVGSTGRSTGPHVHFEVLENGKPVNPMHFLLRR